MPHLIQYLLIAAVPVMFVLFIRSRHGVRMQAGKRLGFLLFLLANIWAVARPEDTTRLAHLVGVGRGADLMLYTLIVAFVFSVFSFYLRINDDEQRVTKLARAVALRDAEVLNRERGLLPPVPAPTIAGTTAAVED
jgi:hypothetical protein